MNLRLVLASQSPRRRELLTQAGIPFTIRVAGIPEQHQPGETPEAYVRRLSQAKAQAVHCAQGEVILGADTVVVVDDTILEKPRDADDARRMLRMLSGRRHDVITGICLVHDQGVISDAEQTAVFFAPLTDAEIDACVASGEPMDKAGAYAIQGLASRFIPRVEGCYFNVVGLPLALVYRRLGPLCAPKGGYQGTASVATPRTPAGPPSSKAGPAG